VPDGFIVKDVRVGSTGRRHLVFATRRQIEILQRCHEWYADSTFDVVKQPFCQLCSIHGQVLRYSYSKQVSLLFIIMSGKYSTYV
jgi:hypothetical protein